MNWLPLFAQTLRFTALKSAPVYIPRIVAEIQERYGFLRVPSATNEMLIPPDENRAMEFEHGEVTLRDGRRVVIDTLRIFRNLIGVSTRTSTADSDEILSGMLEWASEIIHATSPHRIYINQMQVTSEVSLDELSPIAMKMGERVISAMSSYRDDEPYTDPLQVSSIAMSIDPALAAISCDFRLERRVGQRYDTNVYFAQAPLQTKDHVEVLEALEQDVKAARASSSGQRRPS